MDWFPLWNSLRVAAISTVLIFFLGIAAAYYIAKLPKLVKGVLDVVLTLPLVLPPTVVGYLLLRLLGPGGSSVPGRWSSSACVSSWSGGPPSSPPWWWPSP